MRNTIRALCLAFALLPSLAAAQQFPTLPDHTLIGRIGTGTGSGPSQAIPFATLLANIAGTQSANTFYAGPSSGLVGLPSFRALVGADIPNNLIANAMLAQMPAETVKCNNTTAPANAADCSALYLNGTVPIMGSAGGQLLLENGGPAINIHESTSTAYETGTAQAGSTSTVLNLKNRSCAGSPLPQGCATGDYLTSVVTLTGGTGSGQKLQISASSVGANPTVTVSGTFSPVPDATTTYSIGRVDFGWWRWVCNTGMCFFEDWEACNALTSTNPFDCQDEFIRINRQNGGGPPFSGNHFLALQYGAVGTGAHDWPLAANYPDTHLPQTARNLRLQALNASTNSLVDAMVLAPNNALPYWFTPSGINFGVGTGTQPRQALDIITANKATSQFTTSIASSNAYAIFDATASTTSMGLQFGNSTNANQMNCIKGSADIRLSVAGPTATICDTENMRLDGKSHLGFTATIPVATACGTSPTVRTGSTDAAGEVTVGTSAAGCTITFANSGYASAPFCTVTWQANLASMQYTISTTALTIVQTSTSNNKINWHCLGV